jgi:hypothetical protein
MVMEKWSILYEEEARIEKLTFNFTRFQETVRRSPIFRNPLFFFQKRQVRFL